jgi:D-lactate dehydrogenase (cytochrome)
MYDRKDADQMERVEKVVHDMVDRALEMEGSCTVSITKLLNVLAKKLTSNGRANTAWGWARRHI